MVLSQVNYMPDNYNGIVTGLINAIQDGQSQNCENLTQIEVVGCASLKTLDASLLKTILKLPLVGVLNLPKQLAKNIYSTLRCSRERICSDFSIPHLLWDTMNSKEAIDWVKRNDIDLVLNLRTRCIYKSEVLAAPKLGCINIHHGILPQYRGTFCDLYALYEQREAGFSIHKMAKKVDAGEIYRTKVVNSGTVKNYSHYLEQTVSLEVASLIDFLKECTNQRPAKLPPGIENKMKNNQKPRYTKNPTPKTIKEFKKAGMTL